MVREHWREPAFWVWWWRNYLPRDVRRGVAIALFGIVVGGGFLVAALASPQPQAGGPVVSVTTERQLVTDRERGRQVVRVVPVVKRIVLRPSTSVETQTASQTHYLTTPGGVRLVTRPVVRYVDVVKQHVITVAGRSRTVGVTVRMPTTTVLTRTQTRQVTEAQTVTNNQLTTVRQQVTQTQTKTQTQTQTQTQTVTQTQPVTVTQTQTQPVTVTQTQTETVTDTVTLPITVTIP